MHREGLAEKRSRQGSACVNGIAPAIDAPLIGQEARFRLFRLAPFPLLSSLRLQRTSATSFQPHHHKMSNSDKFQQDDAIVDAEPEVQGVLAGEGSDDVGTIGKGESFLPLLLYTLHHRTCAATAGSSDSTAPHYIVPEKADLLKPLVFASFPFSSSQTSSRTTSSTASRRRTSSRASARTALLALPRLSRRPTTWWSRPSTPMVSALSAQLPLLRELTRIIHRWYFACRLSEPLSAPSPRCNPVVAKLLPVPRHPLPVPAFTPSSSSTYHHQS